MKSRKLAVSTVLTVTALLSAVSLCNVHAAPLTVTPTQEFLPHAYFPNMVKMPKSHLVAALHVVQNGQALYLDTWGKMIGQMPLGAQKVQWSGSSPYSTLSTVIPHDSITVPYPAPKPVPRLPKP